MNIFSTIILYLVLVLSLQLSRSLYLSVTSVRPVGHNSQFHFGQNTANPVVTKRSLRLTKMSLSWSLGSRYSGKTVACRAIAFPSMRYSPSMSSTGLSSYHNGMSSGSRYNLRRCRGVSASKVSSSTLNKQRSGLSMVGSDSFYITTPIYYVNGDPHLGHAYTSVMCDIMARFWSVDGKHVHFLSGTDEHGQKVEQSAMKSNEHPQQFVDKNSAKFRDLLQVLNIANTDFIRTTETRHKEVVQLFWQKLVDNDMIYLGSYDGWYSVRDEAFYAESELVDGKAPTGADVEWVKEESYFFKLSAFTERLLKFYEENPDFIGPKSRR